MNIIWTISRCRTNYPGALARRSPAPCHFKLQRLEEPTVLSSGLIAGTATPQPSPRAAPALIGSVDAASTPRAAGEDRAGDVPKCRPDIPG